MCLLISDTRNTFFTENEKLQNLFEFDPCKNKNLGPELYVATTDKIFVRLFLLEERDQYMLTKEQRKKDTIDEKTSIVVEVLLDKLLTSKEEGSGSCLSELVNVEGYSDWIRLVAEFMLKRLQSWKVFINLESTPDTMFHTDNVKYALIRLMRDLRGIAMATNSRRTFGLLFDWLYPAHMPLLLRGILTGLTHQRALAGNYVNFGMFELYGDRALSDALDIALNLALSIPLADILAFCKLTRAYFAFLEVLFNSHMVYMLNLDTSTFMHIVGSLESGLKGLDTSIPSQCASTVDNLAAFYFINITMGEAPTLPTAVNLARHIADCPNLFPEILKTLFEIVLFEDCGNQWSLSRPMLSLILISEQIFSDLKVRIMAYSQPADHHQRISLCLIN